MKTVDAQVRALGDREISLKRQLEELKSDHAKLTEAVEPSAFARYERLRKSKGGTAVVGIEHGVCGGCHMKLTMAIITLAEREEALRDLLDEIAPALGDVLLATTLVRGELTLLVQTSAIQRVLTYLRDQPQCQFKMLVDLCGVIGLEHLVDLLRRSHLFIGNDSGPLHLAVATGIPTVSFFGPETPARYGPTGSAHTVLYKGIPCSPCLNVFNSKDNSSCRDNLCMKSISVDEAWIAVRERLAEVSEMWSLKNAKGAG